MATLHINLYDNKAILDARFPPPKVRAPPGPGLARRLAAVDAFWNATLNADPIEYIIDAAAPGPRPQGLEPDAVEGGLSAYAWHGLPPDQAYDQVIELIVSGLCDCDACETIRADLLVLLDAYFR